MFVIMVIFGEENGTLCVILINYMKCYKYIFFPLYLELCDRSKCILLDWFMQWKNTLSY